MTYVEVVQAKAALEADGHEVTVQAIQQHYGRGDKRQITRVLNQIARRETGAEHPTMARKRPSVKVRPLDLRTTPQGRETDAAQLDAFIAARRAQGYGQATPPPTPATSEDEEAPQTKEARVRQRTRSLVDSLLAEAVPWLTR